MIAQFLNLRRKFPKPKKKNKKVNSITLKIKDIIRIDV